MVLMLLSPQPHSFYTMRATLALFFVVCGVLYAFQHAGQRVWPIQTTQWLVQQDALPQRPSFVLHAKKPSNAFKSVEAAQKIGSFEDIEESKQEENVDNSNEQKGGLPSKTAFANFYQTLVKPGKEMTKKQFMKYDIVMNLLESADIDLEDIDELWLASSGDANTLNLDEAYDLLCMVTDLPDPEETEFLDKEFNKLTGGKGELSFYGFLAWTDVQQILEDEALSMEDVTTIWRDVAGDLNKKINRNIFGAINRAIDDSLDFSDEEEGEEEGEEYDEEGEEGEEDEEEEEIIAQALSRNMNVYDPSFQINSILDEETVEELRESYVDLTGGLEESLSFDAFKQWQDVQDMLAADELSSEELLLLWGEALGNRERDTINYEKFLRLNVRLELYLMGAQDSPVQEKKEGSKKAKVPAMLISEAARPLPKDRELKMMTDAEIAGEGDGEELTAEEKEMMEILDKADSLLNAGSFEDFDRLIGDTDDPRLLAIKETPPDVEKIGGELAQNLQALVKLAKEKKRCGLESRGDSEEVAEMRSFYQAVVDKSPALAKSAPIETIREMMAGKWKLLFTNSEMFGFYNGLTGLSNVFPASKFQDLSIEYSSDGILSETKYYEKLSTPLGPIDAMVYGGWELMKEMSFMTNDVSVITRNYCTKVTAGPFEYKAEENWKSLRAFAMNEVVYIDKEVMIMRNAGALRVFFVFEREQ